MNQIDYGKIIDSSYHYTTINKTIIMYIIFFLCGSECLCVRQHEYHSTLRHLLPSMYDFMID